MKKKWILIALIILAALAGLYFGRNIIRDLKTEKIEQNIEATEVTEIADLVAGKEKTKDGVFTDADSAHKGTGYAAFYGSDDTPVLVFEDNFKVTNGPDLVVYLSPNKVSAGEGLGGFVSLGDLQSSSGTQAYNLPANHAEFQSVVIWCRAFGVLFSTADSSGV